MALRVVVGAAVVQGARVLAAHRCTPLGPPGAWEFPGGKVEDGESEADALVRECREELGVEVAVGRLLGVQPVSANAVLHVYVAELLLGHPEARQDHDEVRWFTAADLGSVEWLPADRDLLAAVAAELAG